MLMPKRGHELGFQTWGSPELHRRKARGGWKIPKY